MRGKRHAAHFRELERHLRQLDGVVVDEHEGVQGQIKLPCQLANLGRLGVVAGEDRDEVLFAQLQPTRAERRRHEVRIVAAHGGEQRAFTPQPAQQTLIDEVAVSSPGGVRGDAVRSVVGQESVPHHSVQVGDQDLLGLG